MYLEKHFPIVFFTRTLRNLMWLHMPGRDLHGTSSVPEYKMVAQYFTSSNFHEELSRPDLPSLVVPELEAHVICYGGALAYETRIHFWPCSLKCLPVPGERKCSLWIKPIWILKTLITWNFRRSFFMVQSLLNSSRGFQKILWRVEELWGHRN